MKCLNPNCERQATVRGICPVCYGRACELVRNGLITWEKLEETGRTLKRKRGGRGLGSTKQWLLGEQAQVIKFAQTL